MRPTTEDWGGARNKAGRPKSVDKPIRRTVYLDQDLVNTIDAYRSMFDPQPTFSEAIRQLLKSTDFNRGVIY